jgi:phenylalanyl-tRNA synthetase beta chain
MRVSDQWLKTFVKTDLAPEKIAHTLTMAGLEVDSLEPAAQAFSNVVVGQIKSLEPHPDADRLQVLSIDAGQDHDLQIVTAAKNVYQDMMVPLALIGAELVGGLKIKKSKLRGVTSEGMLCGPSEIGLSDEKDTGIFELPADAPVGESVKDYLQLDDWIYDIDLTPNRSDCLSMQGVARDLSALLNVPIIEQEWQDPKIAGSKQWPAKIEAKEACARYCLQVIENVDAQKPTPIWMQECLRRAGIKSINVIVDILNFVMLETGQPMHAYDADKLKGALTIRFAKDQEKLTGLDEKDYQLNAKQLVIADESGTVGVAGVIGDLKTSVTQNTQNIVLEAAYFTPSIIMPTSRDLVLHTQSAYRFERGINPCGQQTALARATALILEYAGGEAGPVSETAIMENLPQPKSLDLQYSRIKKILGIEIAKDDVKNYLEALGFICQDRDYGWQVVVPNFRVDVSQEADLIEEIARIYGYDNIPTTQGAATLFVSPEVKSDALSRMMQLLRARGFNECINYAFISEEQFAWIDENKPSQLMTLLNPISQTQSIMRNSLWPGLMQTAIDNQRFGHANLALYETGLCFTTSDDGESRVQTKHLAALWTGEMTAKQWSQDQRMVDFFDLKALAEALGQTIQADFSIQEGEQKPLHPGVCATILVEAKPVGTLGQLHPKLQKQLGFKAPVYLLDLDLTSLEKQSSIKFNEIPAFPGVKRDLCFVVPEAVSFADFEASLKKLGGELMVACQLFDNYQAPDLPKDHKSWAFRLTFMDPKRTLVDDEINVMIDHMVNGLTEHFDAHLRI